MTNGTDEQAASAPVHAFVHTPGPWYVKPRSGPGHITAEVCYGSIDECITDGVYELADAQLIAAAPDLLAHLRHMIWLVEIELKEDGGHIIAGAKAAVQKAISVV